MSLAAAAERFPPSVRAGPTEVSTAAATVAGCRAAFAVGAGGGLASAVALHARRLRRRRQRQGTESKPRRGLSMAMHAARDLEEFRHFASEAGEEFEIFPGQVLGSGAQGTVHVGRRKSTGERVAIKVIPTWRLRLEGEDGMKKLREIEQEVATLRRLGNHPNIAEMYASMDMFRPGDTSPVPHFKFMVMEAVDGRELAEHVALGGPMTESLVRHVFLQIVAALAHVHKERIIHRDLKPENVLVTGDPLSLESTVKLIDFGVAKCLMSGPLKTVVGTPLIMAPEVAQAKIASLEGTSALLEPAQQLVAAGGGAGHVVAGRAHGGRHSFSWGVPAAAGAPAAPGPGAVVAVGGVSRAQVPRPPSFCPKIDVWSAGVVLYTCLAGKVPFSSEREIIEADYLRGPLNHFSEEAKDLLAGMLEKSPLQRCSLHEVLQHPWIACSEDDSCTIFGFDFDDVPDDGLL